MTILRKTVSLNPGESKGVTFKFTPQQAKTYQVLLNGLSGSFVAVELPASPELLSLTIPRTAAGGMLLAEATIYLPKHPAGSGEWESGVPWQGVIDEPVYIINFETEQEIDTGWGPWPQAVLSARLDPNSLTSPTDIYDLKGIDGKGASVWFPKGVYPVKGMIVAYTAWKDPKGGWGITMPRLIFPLGIVGTLEVI